MKRAIKIKKSSMAALTAFILCFFISRGGGTPYKVPGGFHASSEHFDQDGYRDYTDYCEYYYDENAVLRFENNGYYTPVTVADMAELRDFFEDFSGWICYEDGYEDWFSFQADVQMSTTDYFFLESEDSSESYGKYHNYTIGYYDTERYTLYFFHSNT